MFIDRVQADSQRFVEHNFAHVIVFVENSIRRVCQFQLRADRAWHFCEKACEVFVEENFQGSGIQENLLAHWVCGGLLWSSDFKWMCGGHRSWKDKHLLCGRGGDRAPDVDKEKLWTEVCFKIVVQDLRRESFRQVNRGDKVRRVRRLEPNRQDQGDLECNPITGRIAEQSLRDPDDPKEKLVPIPSELQRLDLRSLKLNIQRAVEQFWACTHDHGAVQFTLQVFWPLLRSWRLLWGVFRGWTYFLNQPG